MNSLDYLGTFSSLRAAWSADFDPETAASRLAHDVADAASAKSVYVRFSRNPPLPLPRPFVSASLQRDPELGMVPAGEPPLLNVLGGQPDKLAVFRRCRGPGDICGRELQPTETVLALRIPIANWTAVIWIVCEDSLAQQEDDLGWVSRFTALLTFFVERADRWLNEDFSASDRREFYEELSSVAASHPTTDLRRLCSAWRKHSGAAWVWLWLYNDTAQKWELVACDPSDTAAYLPTALTTPDIYCVAEYCNRIRQHRFIEQPDTWQEHDAHTHETFRVVLGAILKSKGCLALDCVPLIPPPIRPDLATNIQTTPLRIRAAVCLYYTDIATRRPQQSPVYLLMGRLSAQLIVNAYEAQQREILLSLNNLSEKYLTEESSRPQARREHYLHDLRNLISTHLNVSYVSIFWKHPFENRVVCLETSGLWNQEGTPVLASSLPNVTYDPNVGVTGTVFATGKYFRSEIGISTDHKPRFTEIPPQPDGDLAEQRLASLVCPIPFFTGDSQRQRSTPVLGIIRCAQNQTSVAADKARDYDSIQLEELSFITRQVAPVLEAMASTIAREVTVSVIKHDLFAPVRMILDTAEQIRRDLEKNRRPQPYALKDLTSSAFLVQHLLWGLDPNPTVLPTLSAKPLMLEADIVARVKAMLGHYAKQEADMTIVFGDFRSFPCIKADATLIERVLHNLLINAVKYGTEGTEIRVMPLLTRESVVVAVSNYGIGVDPDEAPHIFRGNYRSPRAKLRHHGLGLGLKIAKAAMEAHKGKLELTQGNNPTIFSIVFPRDIITNE